MLQKIREKATGIIGIVILVLISITFALWGVQNYFVGNVSTAVATVNDVEIDVQDFEQRYAQYRNRLAAQGVALSVTDEPIRRREFLEAMIDSEVWRQAAVTNGIAITPEAVRDRIRAIDAFMIDGEFNTDVYVELLSLQGLTPQMLEADIRESALVERIPDVISATAWAPSNEVDRLSSLVNQRRTFEYALLDADNFVDSVSVDDEAIAAYYEANREEFREPEKVAIEYIEIDSATYADEILVDDLVLEDMFEQQKGRFRTPERRRASHILLELGEDADEDTVAETLALATELVEQARGGADFGQLAAENSADVISAEEGGDLGWISRGEMVEPFELALFELEADAISDPVRTGFGYHVIYVTEIDAERGKTFEEAYEDLASEYRAAEAERQFIGLQDRLEELLNYSDSPDMQIAAEELGLDVGETELFPRSGGEGVAANAAVREAAFSETVIEEGLVSDPVLLEANHVVFLRVIEHQDERIQALDEVLEAATEAARREAARQAAEAAAQALLDRMQAGEALETLVAEDESIEHQSVEDASRFGGTTPQALLRQIFELPHPGDEAAGLHLVPVDDDRYAVVSLASVGEADEETRSATAQFMGLRATRSFSAAEVSALGELLRENANIQINTSLVSGTTIQ